MKTLYNIGIMLFVGIGFLLQSCTDLEEQILDEASGKENISYENLDGIVTPGYATLRKIYGREFVWGLQTISSDECMFPTRGSDWDDGGLWRDLHQHTWIPSHSVIKGTWDILMTGIARVNYSFLIMDDFEFTPELTTYWAELKVLRALYYYYTLDLFGKIPYREYTQQDYSVKPAVYTGQEAFDFIINEINEAMPELNSKSAGPYGRINKDIASMLLAKMYLNEEVYTGVAGWTECLSYCDELIESGRYALMSNYWDIFSVENDQFYNNSSEAIFPVIYEDDVNLGYDANTSFMLNSLHYNQTFGGNYSPWNGAVMPQDFVYRFDTINDLRYRSEIIPELGTNRGVLTGLQHDPNGDTIYEGQIPLIYTIECPIFATRMQGARVLKYEPKVPAVDPSRIDYDYIVWRIADVYLMRAEVKIHLGQSGDSDLNLVREIRGLGPISNATLDDVLDERGFELYWEGHRRQDLIRFGKFTSSWHEKPETPATVILFPIPQSVIDAFDDEEIMGQNPGY